MPRNVEIKARVGDMIRLKQRARALANDDGTLLQQVDTFFNVACGRLKLRESTINSVVQPAVLIYYDRPDQQGPKLSSYNLVQVNDADQMKPSTVDLSSLHVSRGASMVIALSATSVLTAALGVKGRVNKSRLLILLDQTRIHLDDVEGLGHFMELEVLLHDDQSEQDGQQIAQNIMDALEINKDDLLDCAYMDMTALLVTVS